MATQRSTIALYLDYHSMCVMCVLLTLYIPVAQPKSISSEFKTIPFHSQLYRLHTYITTTSVHPPQNPVHQIHFSIFFWLYGELKKKSNESCDKQSSADKSPEINLVTARWTNKLQDDSCCPSSFTSPSSSFPFLRPSVLKMCPIPISTTQSIELISESWLTQEHVLKLCLTIIETSRPLN